VTTEVVTARELAAQLIRIDTTATTAGEIDGLRHIAALVADRDDLVADFPPNEAGEPAALILRPRQVSGDVLVLSGHVDTVPADPAGWANDPWSGVSVDGWLHGRGASDMKSGLAALVTAYLAAPAGTRAVLAVSRNEESGCQGAPDVVRGLRAAGLHPAALIVGEPTDGRIVLGHKGPLWITVGSTGRAAHGSTPEQGDNAIVKLATVLARAETDLPFRTHPGLGRESVNIGTVRGGTIRNIVPDRAVAEIDLRTVQPDPEPLLDWWRTQPGISDVTVDVHLPAFWTEPTDPWVATLPAPVSGEPVGFGTEAGPLAAEFGIEHAVIWGPGPTDRMHVPDEAVRLEAIDDAEAGYLKVLRDWRG